MMKRATLAAITLATGFALYFSPAVQAVNLYGDGCNGASGAVCNDIDKGGTDASKTAAAGAISTIIDVLIYVMAAVSVIVIVIGGFQMLVSQGEAEKIKRSRQMIVYALIGLVVALAGWAVVNFVLGQF